MKKKFLRYIRKNILYYCNNGFVQVVYAKFPRYFITSCHLTTIEYEDLIFHKNHNFEEKVYGTIKHAKAIRDLHGYKELICLNCGTKYDPQEIVYFSDGRNQHRNHCICGMKLRGE